VITEGSKGTGRFSRVDWFELIIQILRSALCWADIGRRKSTHISSTIYTAVLSANAGHSGMSYY
jgi:hypothetical protein